jgi:ABC-type spermidine/putrescine transport system permease subunit II
MISRAGAIRRILVWTGAGMRMALVAFMLAPALLIAILSFSGEPILRFPPTEWGLRQYAAFLASPYWLHSVRTSFEIATPTAILALLIGIPAAFAFHRSRVPGREWLQLLAVTPLVLPGVAFAVAMYTFFAQLRLLGRPIGLVLAHTILAVPFVIIILGATINRIPPELELVAMTLGASRARARLGITLRLLAPAIGAAFVFAFLASFDEAVFVNFLGGPDLITLPKAIFDSVRTGVDPLITAIATLLMVATGVVSTIAVYLRFRGSRPAETTRPRVSEP